ncbi:MAG: Polysaccharide deacetylase family protein, PEP-CTERM locus subfamily [uncultured Thiotrichaceae bacterium]|uniref:Polysaccharide deacetylase family protein, PEP-CTERM locus subfamily n=1 Tax=uncultured Thiotrichaceae bacterium TaxID=298394 RepID=A0A6S6UDU2_9GAMM|nr:MAG: Polysaccharide deacetylase family protein, PEP-CTERM locus subfamily [uncultured Thiotrichaceae bacterium]
MIFTSNITDWQHSMLDQTQPVSRHVWNHTLSLLEIIDFHEITGTFFIATNVAEKYPVLVRKISARGHEVAPYFEYPIGAGSFAKLAERSIHTIEDITGTKTIGARTRNLEIESLNFYCKVLNHHGIKYDSSLYLAKPVSKLIHKHTELEAFAANNISEYHLPTLPLLGKRLSLFGSQSFRLLPYALSHYAGSLLPREKTVFCIQSFDLGLDENNDISKKHSIPLDRRQDFIGRKKVSLKLQKLLRDFPFLSFRDAYYFCDGSSPQYQPEKLYYT